MTKEKTLEYYINRLTTQKAELSEKRDKLRKIIDEMENFCCDVEYAIDDIYEAIEHLKSANDLISKEV